MQLRRSLTSTVLLVVVSSGCASAREPAAAPEPALPSPSPGPGLAGPTVGRLADYVGLSEREAGALAARRGVPWRVVCRDGAGLAVTADLQPARVNLVVVDGEVVRAGSDTGAVESR